MSFNPSRRKNRNLNNASHSNYGSSASKIDKSNNRMKNPNDKGQGSNRFEGIYSNPDFMYANTSLIGTLANIVHKDGHIYEGVFNTFSPDFEIVLNTVSKVVPKAETNAVSPNVGSLLASLTANHDFMESVIFKLSDIVMMSISNVNMDFAIKGNFTDTEISKFNPSQLDKERDLVPWDDCQDDSIDDSIGNDMSLYEDGGWDANDMFKLHEKKYNMSTTYKESMEGYTVPLDKDAKDYGEREAEANRIARLIESDVTSKDRLAKEDGDEEDKFSAVVRPNATNEPLNHQPPAHVNKQTNYSNNQNNQSNSFNQNSRHDLNNARGNRNKNTSGNMNVSGQFSSSNSLNRSKNQSINSSGSMQQPYHFSTRSNGPMNNNRLNSRSDQQQHNHFEDKDLHRSDRMMQNDQQTQQNQSRNNPNNRRYNIQPPMPKREETTHDLKKFSSNFKIGQPGSGSNNQMNDSNKDTAYKDLPKDAKQSNLNRQTDGKSESVVNKNNNEQSSNLTSNKPLINKDNSEDSQIVNKSINKPLIDKPPKDKSPPSNGKSTPVANAANNKNINNEQQPSDKAANNKQQQQQAKSDQHHVKPAESSQQQPTETTIHKDSEQQQSTKENVKQEQENDSIKSQSLPPEPANSQASADSGKGLSNTSSTTELQNAENTLKKSTLNPNAKEFKFNPGAKPYTPKYVPPTPPTNYPGSTVSPAMNVNLPPPAMQPNAGMNPQLISYQPNAHHLAGPNNAAMHTGQQTAGMPPHPAGAVQAQMPISQISGVHQGGNQQLIATPVLHPGQALMAHPAGAQVHHQMHQPGAHQMLPFPHLISPQSIQFVQTNPQGSMHHPHPQSAHHSHHPQTSSYIIPAVPNQVSTANLPPNAQLTSVSSNPIAVNYATGQPGVPQQSNPGLVNTGGNQVSSGQNQSSGGNPRSSRNKAGQYHNNQSGNPRSNQGNQQSNSNQQITGNPNQQNIQNAHVVNAATSTVYSQQPIHLQPNFNPAGPQGGVNPGTYQIYHHPQFQAHHNPHHPRLMSPQSLGMVHHPGYPPVGPGDPTFQQIYGANTYMTNMAGVPQFVTVQPSPSTPASVSSPIHHLSHHGSNTMINNIGVVSTANVQRSSNANSGAPNGSQQQVSNNQAAQQTPNQQQQMIIATNNGAGQYATQNAMMPSFIIAQPSLHSVQPEQTVTPPLNQVQSQQQ